MNGDLKALQMFGLAMAHTSRISENEWIASTSKRLSLVIPKGVRVWDEDLDTWFTGDGASTGGVKEGNRRKIRKIGIGAASGTTTVVSGTDIFTDSKVAALRTGDGITFAAGTGALPSGITAAQYFIIKEGDVARGEGNGGTTFKVASTRANALAKTAVDVLGAGTAGWTTVISTVCANPSDDIVVIDPVSAAVSVALPDASSNEGVQVTVKRAKTATNAVTIKELDASGNISASGSVIIDDTTGYVTLKAATDDFVSVVANDGKYWSVSKQVTP
jgi:hypothetical protein